MKETASSVWPNWARMQFWFPSGMHANAKIVSLVIMVTVVCGSVSGHAEAVPSEAYLCYDADNNQFMPIASINDDILVKMLYDDAVPNLEKHKRTMVALENGPFVVFLDKDRRPVYALHHRLDGWITKHEVLVRENKWFMGKILTDKSEVMAHNPKNRKLREAIYDIWEARVGSEARPPTNSDGSRPGASSDPHEKAVK